MNANDLRPGQQLTNAPSSSQPRRCEVTSVARAPWTKRVTRFWVRWEGTDGNAPHMPEDAAYLNLVAEDE